MEEKHQKIKILKEEYVKEKKNRIELEQKNSKITKHNSFLLEDLKNKVDV